MNSNGLLGYIINILSGAGNALDLPGSSVRDVLAGQNPFDQWATPFHEQNRTTGRDLARNYGMAGNQDTWGNWLGGMAIETALDPLSYAGIGLLNKGAKMKPAQVMKSMYRDASNPFGYIDDGMEAAGKYAKQHNYNIRYNNTLSKTPPTQHFSPHIPTDEMDDMVGFADGWVDDLDDIIDADKMIDEVSGFKPAGKFQEARGNKKFWQDTKRINKTYSGPSGYYAPDPNFRVTPAEAMINNIYKKRLRKPTEGLGGGGDPTMGF